MKNSILHQTYARYEKNIKNQNCSFLKNSQTSSWIFFDKRYLFINSSKTLIWKLKIQFSRQSIEDAEKSCETKLFISKRSTTICLI